MSTFRVMLANLLRRRTRSLLTTAGIAAAVAAGIALVSLASGFEHTWLRTLENRGVDMIVLRAGVADRLASSLNESIAQRLLQIPSVAAVSPSLSDRVQMAGCGALGVPLHGFRTDSFVMTRLALVTGRTLREDDAAGVFFGQQLAEATGRAPGDEVEIEGTKFRVVGIFSTPSQMENNSAIVLLSTLQRLMDRPGQVNQVQVQLANSATLSQADEKQFRSDVEQLCDDNGRKLSATAMAARDFVARSIEIRIAREMAAMTTVLAVLLGAVGVLNTMLMSVLERTQEIGILRAIGWRRPRIIWMILGETSLLCVAGGVLGLTLGTVLVNVFCRSHSVGGLIEPDTSLWILAGGMLLACLAGLLGGWYPAWRGSCLLPTEALRYD